MAIEFSPAPDLLIGSDARLLLASDLNGDGNLDLVTDFYDSGSNSGSAAPGSSAKAGVAVFWGTGGGQFAAAQKYAIEQVLPNPQYEFYQQQYQQYQQGYQTAYQNYQSFVNSLPPGTPIAPFTYFPFTLPAPSPTINSPIIPTKIAVGDVDRDGKPDLITVGSAGSQKGSIVSVLRGTGSGFSAAINSPVASLSDTPGGLAIADFNRDGNLDVAAISAGNISSVGDSSTSKQQVSILLGDGTGKFASEKSIALGFDTADLVAADFNGDGSNDLAVGGTVRDGSYSGYSAKLSILLSNGTGDFSPPNTVSNPVDAYNLLAADFNGDGKVDLGSNSGFIAGEGNGQFKSTLQPFQLSGSSIATGDFNGDGKLDIAGYQSNGYGPGSIGILLGDGKGNYTFPAPAATFNSLSPIVAAGDFDRDGKLDIAALNSTAKSISVLFNRSTGSDLLVTSNDTIDASIESGGLTLDLKKGTLQIGGVNKPLSGSYRRVRGSKQADRITGGQVGESIDGFAGDDAIAGGDGNDYLTGNLGNDTLTGGKGKDNFVFSYDGLFGSGFLDGGATPFDRAIGVDKITDFELGKDRINLYRQTFTAFPNRRISFESVATKKAAQKSKSLITYIPKTGSLFYNENGAKAGFGSGGQFADLTDGLELRAKDFVVT